MNKNIVIIGAGISGLTLLYYLKKKYAGWPHVKITLLEAAGRPGGNIRTIQENDCLFECGPSGFLANQPAMLELVEELGLAQELITADAASKKRFVLVEEALHAVPGNLPEIFNFKPMTLTEKLRIFAEPFVPKSKKPNEAVYDFAKRRFGVKAARYFVDPMVSGIYAGDSEFLSVEAAFPGIYELEQRHGSVIRGMFASGGKKLKAELKSFRKGMGALVDALSGLAQESIRLNEPVREIIRAGQYYLAVTDRDKYPADEIFICTPAYAAGDLVGKLDADLGTALKSIDYAPLAVAGLVFEKTTLQRTPQGFGYLIPSVEESQVLGVLIESNVFEGRAGASQVLFRVMIGGTRNPECIQKSQQDLLAVALKEIDQRYGVTTSPAATIFASYSKAIPQYETAYLTLKKRIEHGLTELPRVHLLANYLNGVAVNDCVRNAKETAGRIEI
jgi:oxygen-dependent protoporphyrinogen oxidase